MIFKNETAGLRLDFCLKSELGGGLREARRILRDGRVSVNGRAGKAGLLLQPGDIIELAPPAATLAGLPPYGSLAEARLIAKNDSFAAFYKPAGLPSAIIAGSPRNSLEAMIRATWDFIPCNRLDTETSGLVLYAGTPEYLAKFKRLEAAGLIKKEYLAIVRGELKTELTLKTALNTADRARTTPLLPLHDDQALTRHTTVTPLGPCALPGVAEAHTLVRAGIKRGARHQIRVHLALAGFPIAGDRLYSPEPPRHKTDDRLYLHHQRIIIEDFSPSVFPEDWPCLPECP